MRMVSHVTMSLFINVLTGHLFTKSNANIKLNRAEMIWSEPVPKSLEISLKVHSYTYYQEIAHNKLLTPNL